MSRPIEIPRGEDDEWTAGANAIVNMLFHYIGESGKSYKQVEDEAGLGGKTLKSWRNDGVFPQLDSISRALRAVGYTLVTEEVRPSPASHPGYFAMRDKIAPPGYVDWPLPTPGEIAADNAAVPSPEERRKLAETSAARRIERRKKLFEERSKKRKRPPKANGSTTPVVKRRNPSAKAKMRKKYRKKHTLQRIKGATVKQPRET